MEIKMLNNEQKQAVEIINQPLIIYAGAGTGKTRTLVQKVAYLIQNLNVQQSSILCITFTRNAANELRERISGILGVDTEDLKVTACTFHSLASKILYEHSEMGTIISEEEAIDIIKKCIPSHILDYTNELPEGILRFLHQQKIKKEYVLNGVIDYSSIPTMEQPIFKETIKTYLEVCDENRYWDFDDLLIYAYRLLINDSIALDRYKWQYKYIMVDEFQDTNWVQFQLFLLLAEGNKNICVVGDDDQSIYGWRGADYTIIQNFKEYFPDAKTIFLNKTYRCKKDIVALANYMISKNIYRTKKEIVSASEENGIINFKEYEDNIKEAWGVAEKIKRLVEEKGYKYSDFAILYRVNSYTQKIENALLKNNIPYVVKNNEKYFNRQEIKDILAFINILVNDEDIISLQRVIGNMPYIPHNSLKKLLKYIEKNVTSVNDFFSNLSESFLKLFKIEDVKLFFELKELYNYGIGSRILKEQTRKYIQFYRSKVLRFRFGRNVRSELYNDTLNNIKILQDIITSYREVEEFLMYVKEFDTNISNMEEEAVNLMTFHSAKGLEFKVVFVVGVTEDIFPTRGDIEEERRLMYVAITRAIEELYISGCLYTYSINCGKNISLFGREIKKYLRG
jgi:DNA helicase-2/ATP-dependent DNA helicase PcrA